MCGGAPAGALHKVHEEPEQSEPPAEQEEEEREEETHFHSTFLHYISMEPEGTSRQRSESVPRAFQPHAQAAGKQSRACRAMMTLEL